MSFDGTEWWTDVEESYPRHDQHFAAGNDMSFFESRRRCRSILYTSDGRKIQCMGKSPGPDESHIHSGRSDSGVYLTWSDKDAEESKKIYQESLVTESETPLIGWRVWELIGSILCSITSKTLWTDPVLRANGRPYSHLLGESLRGRDEDYGIHCYKDPKLLYHYMGYWMSSKIKTKEFGSWPVFGAIELTGRVVEHTLGYRAEIATFRRLWLVSDNFEIPFKKEVAKELEERYQCDVDVIEDSKVEGWSKFFTNEEL